MPSKPMTYDRAVERKQQTYRKLVKPSLQNEAEISQFYGGGRVEHTTQDIMRDRARMQAKASLGREPIIVDVAFRDENGIYHYDEESALQYDPLLMPGRPAAPQQRQAYPAWIDMDPARRGSIASIDSDSSSTSGHHVPYADSTELDAAFGGAVPAKTLRRQRTLGLSDPYGTAPTPVSAGHRVPGAYTYDARRDFIHSSFAPPPPLSAPVPHPHHHHHHHHYSAGAPPMAPSQAPSFDSHRARRFTLTSSSSTNILAPPPPMPGSGSASVKSSKSAVKNIFKMGRKA